MVELYNFINMFRSTERRSTSLDISKRTAIISYIINFYKEILI